MSQRNESRFIRVTFVSCDQSSRQSIVAFEHLEIIYPHPSSRIWIGIYYLLDILGLAGLESAVIDKLEILFPLFEIYVRYLKQVHKLVKSRFEIGSFVDRVTQKILYQICAGL